MSVNFNFILPIVKELNNIVVIKEHIQTYSCTQSDWNQKNVMTLTAVPHFGCQSKNLLLLPGFSNAPPGIKKKLGGCKMTNSKWTKRLLVAWPSVCPIEILWQLSVCHIKDEIQTTIVSTCNFPIQIENYDCLSLLWSFDNFLEDCIYRVTCQFLVVFPAVFDQFSGRFSKEDNSVGFKIF